MTWHLSPATEALIVGIMIAIPALAEAGIAFLVWRLLIRKRKDRTRQAYVGFLGAAALAQVLALIELGPSPAGHWREFTVDRAPGATHPAKYVTVAFGWYETRVLHRITEKRLRIDACQDLGAPENAFYGEWRDEDPLLVKLWRFHRRKDRDPETARELWEVLSTELASDPGIAPLFSGR